MCDAPKKYGDVCSGSGFRTQDLGFMHRGEVGECKRRRSVEGSGLSVEGLGPRA